MLYKEKATYRSSSEYIHSMFQGLKKKKRKKGSKDRRISQVYYICQMAKCHLPKIVSPVLIAY